ncbi:MAG: hypothetical protein V2A34_14955 [Lentisphaerota bacterium]
MWGLSNPARAQSTSAIPLRWTQESGGDISTSLEIEARNTLHRGLQWLIARQNPQGYWPPIDDPARSALSLRALIQGGMRAHAAISNVTDYLLSCAQEDGSIWRPSAAPDTDRRLALYSTALCMTALQALNDPATFSALRHARHYLASSNSYPDPSTASVVFEAMRLTQQVEALRPIGETHADLDWSVAREFAVNETNQFDESDGVSSRPYTFLLAFLFANLQRDDPRIQAMFCEGMRLWPLDEKPGMFYLVLAKALSIYGQDLLTTVEGQLVNWRSELILKLLSFQKTEEDTGFVYWMNPEGVGRESDPVFVTSCSLLALEIALRYPSK